MSVHYIYVYPVYSCIFYFLDFLSKNGKIKKLRKIIDSMDQDQKPLIEVDGGIKLNNIKKVADAGADILVSGSGIFATENYYDTVSEMRKLIGS